MLVASVAFVVDSWAFGTTGASNMVAGRADEKHHCDNPANVQSPLWWERHFSPF